MAMIGRLGTESVKGLGPGAYLVSVLPSAMLVVSVYLLSAASLYPWTTPPEGKSRGFASIVETLGALSAAQAGALITVVLLVSVLVRPLHVRAVQLLEGYWGARAALRAVDSLATERQLRRYSRARARRGWAPAEPEWDTATFRAVVEYARRLHRIERRKARARQIADSYPGEEASVLPTLLGNVLRRAETTAGERYGMQTVTTYPRLYPYLGARLHDALAVQFNLLDSTAAFAIVFWTIALLSVPTAWLGGAWFVVPVGFFLAGSVAYAGAMAAAREHGTLLATAYDLHRFDLLSGLHIALPEKPDRELSTNEQLSEFFSTAESFANVPDSPMRPTIASSYEHPEPPLWPAGPSAQAATSDPGDKDDAGGDDAGGDGDNDGGDG